MWNSCWCDIFWFCTQATGCVDRVHELKEQAWASSSAPALRRMSILTPNMWDFTKDHKGPQDWTHCFSVIQRRPVWPVAVYCNTTHKRREFLNSLVIIRFSGRTQLHEVLLVR